MNRNCKKYSATGLILLIYVAFMSLGLPDGLLGVAWPDMRANFGLPLDALGILLFASTTGYLLSSFFNGVLVKKMGVARLLSASCCATGLALLGYTLVPVWWLLPPLAVVAGLGAGAIDAGLNTYVDKNFNEDLMQWLHASFGVGITIGPIIMSTGLRVTNSWRAGYIVVSGIQILLAVIFILTVPMWNIKDTGNNSSKKKDSPDNIDYPDIKKCLSPSLGQTLKNYSAWLSIALFFIYTGLELSLGHWAYSLLTESRGIAPASAGFWVSAYWGTFTIGRILAGFLSRNISSIKMLEGGVILGIAGSILLCWGPVGWVSLTGVVLIGFAIAPIFPALVSSTSYRVGRDHSSNTIGIQIAAAGLGAALLPGLAGVLARQMTLEVIPVFILCLFLIFYILYRISYKKREACT